MLVIVAGFLWWLSYTPNITGVYTSSNKGKVYSLTLASNHDAILYTYNRNSKSTVIGNYTQSRKSIFIDLKDSSKTKHIVGKVNDKHQLEFKNFNPKIFNKSCD
ncbi:hypothetical protein [Apilactobacillus ozensis]|uniref:hypothetical protein n=1 Tax=Apilactobacillus ozensis TaxID=866801 RepID=UPI0020936F03|nr:hypothetical protein [Apilactobacillus ozensis]